MDELHQWAFYYNGIFCFFCRRRIHRIQSDSVDNITENVKPFSIKTNCIYLGMCYEMRCIVSSNLLLRSQTINICQRLKRNDTKRKKKQGIQRQKSSGGWVSEKWEGAAKSKKRQFTPLVRNKWLDCNLHWIYYVKCDNMLHTCVKSTHNVLYTASLASLLNIGASIREIHGHSSKLCVCVCERETKKESNRRLNEK